MNRFVILFLLIIILPTQLLITYIIHSTDNRLTFQEITISSIKESSSSFLASTSSVISYYSTYDHIKELFFIPYVPKKKKQPNFKIPKSRSQLKSDLPQDDHLSNVIPEDKDVTSDSSQSFAKEVEAYNHKNVYFARSQSLRQRKSTKTIKYKIGDVVRHTIDGYHGVVIGWDHTCQAPEKWITEHGYYSQTSSYLLKDPHYLVLGDSDKQTSYFYIPQTHLMREKTAKVRSPKLSKYFEKYSKSKNKYYPKNWLIKIYPDDQ